MALTTTSAILAGVNIFYDRKFLRLADFSLRLAQHGQKRDLPKGTGKTIQFFRYNRITVDPSTSNLTEGTNPTTPITITGQDIQAAIAEWGDFSKHSSLVEKSHIDKKLSGVVGLWGDMAGQTVDLLCWQEVCANGAYPWRADDNNSGDGEFTYEGTVTTATSTTVFADTGVASNTDFGDANDDLNQSVVVMLTGVSAGQARPCTDYVTSGGVITVSPAWDIQPAVGDTFVVTAAHGLTSGTDLLTTTTIRGAVAKLRNNGATPISNGFYVGILDPDTEANLMADTNWTNLMQYKDTPEIKAQGLFTGEVGQWGGVRWVRTTKPFRFPIETVGTAGTGGGVGANVPGSNYTNYAAGGAVHASLILGMEAFGVTTFRGEPGSILKPGIIVKNPGPQDTSNPLNMYSTVGWYMPFVAKALNPLFAIQIWSTP